MVETRELCDVDHVFVTQRVSKNHDRLMAKMVGGLDWRSTTPDFNGQRAASIRARITIAETVQALSSHP